MIGEDVMVPGSEAESLRLLTWGGYAPDWNAYLGVAACTVTTTPMP